MISTIKMRTNVNNNEIGHTFIYMTSIDRKLSEKR